MKGWTSIGVASGSNIVTMHNHSGQVKLDVSSYGYMDKHGFIDSTELNIYDLRAIGKLILTLFKLETISET